MHLIFRYDMIDVSNVIIHKSHGAHSIVVVTTESEYIGY